MKNTSLLLEKKVCVVTGGAGLLGKQFSLSLARAGAEVLIFDIDEKRGQQALKEVQEKTGNESVYFYEADITDEDQLAQVVAKVVKKHGRIDVLINNAYPRNKNYGKVFEDVSYKDFCENVNMHLGGYFLMSKVVAAHMRLQNSGVIINMGSIYGFAAPRFEIYAGTSMTTPVEYAAIKGGVINLTKYLASYLGSSNIRVNAVSPGGIFDEQNPQFVERYTAKVPLGKRMGNPDDISEVVAFLASDGAKYITGQNIVVDGGWSL